MEIELRKNRYNMYIVGTGTVLFSVWNLFKGIAVNILSESTLKELAGKGAEGLPPGAIYLIIGLCLVIDCMLRLVIGFQARAEAMGDRQGNLYLVLTGLLCFSYLLSTIKRITGMSSLKPSDLIDQMVLLVIDGASLVIFTELLYAALKVRRLTRIMEKEKGPGS